ncbi:GTPase ObgE [Desulfococcaceae bacterium HSG9]|nr:GTPase ObgE [Desulfococcaceae bacterium HSG9]
MKFIDEAVIEIQSGHGGAGCVSFRRERSIPLGGPDGGNGGKGGDVILYASPARRTLHQFQFKHFFKADNGTPGKGKDKTGKSGADLTIDIPPGTIVSDYETGNLIKDFTNAEETVVIAKGGRGGQGNAGFKTSKRRSPRFAQPGEPEESLKLKLELKLLADVGLVGLPNAGKSTLITSISGARPRIGDYPFTTLTPGLGVVQTEWAEPFVVADIPGLIEGAHKGTGLGDKFLRHIERTRVLVHLIDASVIDPDNPLQNLRIINTELEQYNHGLITKPQLIVLNKLDIPGAQEKALAFKQASDEADVITIAAINGMGIKALLSAILLLLDRADAKVE